MKVLSWDVGLRTLSYCILSGTWNSAAQHMDLQLHAWDAIDVQVDTDAGVQELTGTTRGTKRKKVDTASIEQGATMMMDTLHRRAHLFADVDVIVIEQQPAGGHNRHSNVRMKVMSHVIQSYFYARTLLVEGGVKAKVTFVSPASKLVEMERQPESGATINQQYSRNKKFAVLKATELLQTLCEEQHPLRLSYQSANVSKKDDLADALLLNYYYLLKHLKPPAKRTRKAKISAGSIESTQPCTAD